MRQTVRRALAALLVVVGVGVVTSELPAQAAPVSSHVRVSPTDWVW